MATTTISDFTATNPLATFTLGNSSWSGQVSTSGGQIVAGTADSGGGGYATFSAVDLSTPAAGSNFWFKLTISLGGYRGTIKLSLKDSGSGACVFRWNTSHRGIAEFVNFDLLGLVGADCVTGVGYSTAPFPTTTYVANRPDSNTIDWSDLVRFDIECTPSAWGTTAAHFKLVGLTANY